MDPQPPWNADDAPSAQTKTGDTSCNLGIPDFAPPAPDEAVDPLEAAPGQVQDSCPCCTAQLDITGIAPLTTIACPSCRQEFRVLAQYAGFALSEQIGAGPAGAIYLARNLPSEQPVALKIFREGLGEQPEYMSRVVAAARSLSGFSHPHITRVLSADFQNGLLYVAAEYVGEASLAETITKRGRLPEPEALTLAQQLVEGLQAAANHGLEHGDLKPSNILYTAQGSPKISDFGHGLLLNEAAQAPAETAQLPFYSSPEKLSLQGEDLRSDFYSLGAILFHLLTGRPPFPGHNAVLVAQKHLEHRAPSVQAFMPEISSGTASVIAKMLEKTPARRHRNCQELLEHLRFARSELGAGKAASSPNTAPLTAEFASTPKRSKLWMILAAAGPAVLILGVGCWLNFRSKPAPQPEASAPPLAQSAPAPEPIPSTSPQAPAANQPASEKPAFESPMRDKAFAAALAAVGGSKPDAAKLIDALVEKPKLDKTMLCWALAMQGIQRLDADKMDEAVQSFQKLAVSAKWVDAADLRISFTSLGEAGAASTPAAGAEIPLFDFRRLSFLVQGLKAWNHADLENAVLLLNAYATPDSKKSADPVLAPLGPLATNRLKEDKVIADLVERGKKARNMPDAYGVQRDLAAITGPLAPRALAARTQFLAARADAAKDLAGISPEAAYRLVNRATGLCLTQPESGGANADENPTPQLKPMNPGNIDQCWRLQRYAYGQTSIVNAHTALSLSAGPKSTPEFAAVLKTYAEGDHWESYIVKKIDSRYFTFACETSNKLLGVKTGGAGEVVVSDDRQSPDQQWELQPVLDGSKWARQEDRIEAEWLNVLDKSEEVYRVIDATDLSGQFATIFDAYGPGAFVTLQIPQVKAGAYEVRLGIRASDVRGKFQVSMGPEKGPLSDVGSEQDPYQQGPEAKEFVLGPWTNPKTQDVAMKFTVTGKNPASKTYMVNLDYIKILPAK